MAQLRATQIIIYALEHVIIICVALYTCTHVFVYILPLVEQDMTYTKCTYIHGDFQFQHLGPCDMWLFAAKGVVLMYHKMIMSCDNETIGASFLASLGHYSWSWGFRFPAFPSDTLSKILDTEYIHIHAYTYYTCTSTQGEICGPCACWCMLQSRCRGVYIVHVPL